MTKKILILMVFATIVSLVLSSCCIWPFMVNDRNVQVEDDPGPEEMPDEEEEFIIEEFKGFPDLSEVSRLKISGQAIDVDIAGNYAYLTSDLGELYIINIKDKSDPKVVGKCPDVDSANIVIIEGDYAYISYTEWMTGEDEFYTECGFKIVDIKDKEDPLVIGDYKTGENNRKSVYGFFIEGEYAFINTSVYQDGSGLNTLEIIDISNKKSPKKLGSLEFEGSPSSVWVSGNYAYINTNYYDFDEEDYTDQSSLLVIDIEDRKNPELVGSCDLPSNSWGIYVSGDFAYVSSNVLNEEDNKYTDSLLQVVDLTDKTDPRPLEACKIPGGAWELDRVSDYIYVSSLDGGIFAVNISNADSPIIADRLFTGGTSYDITIQGNYGYIADGFEGLIITQLSDSSTGEDNIIAGGDTSGNIPPTASISVFGDSFSDYYTTRSPVYFSASGSFDPEGSEMTFDWVIEEKKYSSEENIQYYFQEPGKYEIELVVSDGENSSRISEVINVADMNTAIDSKKQHNITLEIEYRLTNFGPGSLTDIECFMRTPQTYYPFQIVNSSKPSISNTEEVFDNNWNLLTHFNFEDELPEGETLIARIDVDISTSEYYYAGGDGKGLAYLEDDRDLIEYTRDDLFIDSDNQVIKDTARSLIGDETDPTLMAGILYDFVVASLYYDYDRADDRNYPLMYASEILEEGSGVCADYAILYTALLRSVNIPARLAAGIPVYTILFEEGKEIDIGHAWVEVKLPGIGWVPMDITNERAFMESNFFLNIVTEKGPGYLYENTTMDWGSYYYDGFSFSWDGEERPGTGQEFIFRVKGLDLDDITFD